MIFPNPHEGEFTKSEAKVVIIDYLAEGSTRFYTQNMPPDPKLLFANYLGETKLLIPELTSLGTVVVQGFSKHSAAQTTPSPGHTRHFVHWLRHGFGFTGRIVVISSMLRELDIPALLECGADEVLDRSDFYADPVSHLATTP